MTGYAGGPGPKRAAPPPIPADPPLQILVSVH